MSLFTSTAAFLSRWAGRRSWIVKSLRPAYETILDGLYAETGIVAGAEGHSFQVCPRVRKFVSLEDDVTEYLSQNISRGDTVLDVGAFLGFYAILEARWVGSEGRVVTFEPTPGTLPLLNRHLVMNGVQERVTAFPCAVGGRRGAVDFYQHEFGYLNSARAKDPTARATRVSVPMITIDDACELFGLKPTLMRIDVQGLEAEVLEGASATIINHPELKILVEIHPQLWHLHGLNQEKFAHLLGCLGLEAKSPNGTAPVYEPDMHLVLTRRKPLLC